MAGWGLGVSAALFGVVALLVQCQSVRRQLVVVFTPEYEVDNKSENADESHPDAMRPAYDGRDTDRPRIAVDLEPIFEGLVQPTDLQFVPGAPDLSIALQKQGQARWIDLELGTSASCRREATASRPMPSARPKALSSPSMNMVAKRGS